MAPRTELLCREMSKAEAETIWVASFLGPDPAFRHQPPPLIFELEDDGRARLYLATYAKAALVYGFSLDADSQVASWFARKH